MNLSDLSAEQLARVFNRKQNTKVLVEGNLYDLKMLGPKRSKMKNVPTVIDGIRFLSKKEAGYYCQLKIKVAGGLIDRFEMQVPFVIKINEIKICTYYADFVEYSKGIKTVVDVKGRRLDVYKLKKKMVEAYFGIKVIEK